MNNEQLKPTKTETVVAYIHRLCTDRKTLGLTWPALTTVLNKNLNLDYSESWYRKGYRTGKFAICPETETVDVDKEDNSCEIETNLNTLLQTIAEKKVELSDMLIQNNAYIRRLSREETLKTIAHDYAVTMSNKKQLTPAIHPFTNMNANEQEGILLLSDWHYGMVCDNPWNTFDPSVCVKRVNQLLEEVLNIIKEKQIDTVHVLDLADLIAGRIHTQIRIESRYDVITQTMNVAELLAEFLTELSRYCYVYFYSCLDNHSRLEPNKKESLDLESLARIIPWYLTERLKNHDCICICDNKYGPDIITCNVAGHNIIGVHGDADKPTTAMDRLTMLTHEHYDMLCTAHRHHMFLEEINETIVIGNSSLMGVDSYSAKLRLSSKPSQTFIVSSPKNVCKDIHRIILD